MKSLKEYINESKDLELRIDASEDEYKKFAKVLTNNINIKNHLDEQLEPNYILDALNKLGEENYPVHLSDFGLGPNSYLMFDNGKTSLQFDDEDGWTEMK
jgi:hypothetical protein